MMTMRDFFLSERLRRAFPTQRKRLALADAYQRCFASPEGQVVLRDLIHEAGVLRAVADPSDSRFEDGKRALALHILNRLRWSVAELQQLGQEITYDALVEREEQLGAPQFEGIG